MLNVGEFLPLRTQKESAKFLKTWLDTVIDYFILVLVLMSVVTGVVALNARDPVCVPTVTCPRNESATNGSYSQKQMSFRKICEANYKLYHSSRTVHHNSSVTVVTKSPDRNLFDYINSRCKTICLNFFYTFFPNILLFEAGVLLVFHNAWLILAAPITDHFSRLVDECYQCEEDDESMMVEKLETLEAKIKSYNGCSPCLCNWKPPCCPCCRGSGARCAYLTELLLQSVVLLAVLICNSIYGINHERDGSFTDCRIDVILPGLTYDYFSCSYPLARFYWYTCCVFVAFVGLHFVFTVIRWILFVRMLCIGPLLGGMHADLGFLLHLLDWNNPCYAECFGELYKMTDAYELVYVTACSEVHLQMHA